MTPNYRPERLPGGGFGAPFRIS